MKKIILTTLICLSVFACQRDLGSTVYTEQNTVGVVLDGVVVSARQVTVKTKDKLQDNTTGGLIGGVAGGLGGNNLGKGKGNTAATVGGALLGAALGAVIENELGTQKAMEYIVKVEGDNDDTISRSTDINIGGNSVAQRLKNNVQTTKIKTKTISVVQGMEEVFAPGQKVYVIYNDDNRARLTPRY
jgi:outer membrane lipoprotein SlyB